MKPELIALVFLIIYVGVVEMGTREEFEKLLVISNILEDRGVYWSAINDRYESCHKWETYFVGYLNGAWYAFQEQQKKIDAIKSKLSAIYDASDENETAAHLLDEIQELLK